MRIIAGRYKGFILKEFSGKFIRPTPSKVREAVFDMIGFKVIESDFLDLFAGTGAMGIEAISRGAKNVTFIERNRIAIDLINANLDKIGQRGISNIIKNDYNYSINILNEQQKKYDIIFLDPPYKKNLLQKTLKEIDESFLLKANSIVIAQCQINEEIPTDHAKLACVKEKKYGKTRVTVFTYKKQS